MFLRVWIVVGLIVASASWGKKENLDNIAVTVEKIETLRSELGITSDYLNNPNLKNLKIAVLDNGFAGISEKSKRRYVPKNTKIIHRYPDVTYVPLDPKDVHGRHMIQVLWAVTGYDADLQVRGYNSSGPEQTVAAVDAAIKWQADIVVFSQNWETFTNFDGTGWINEAVQDAVDEGIIWINAAGNYGGMVYNGEVPKKRSFHEFRVTVDENEVTAVLSWTGFRAGPRPRGTDKDLDLYLYRGPSDWKEKDDPDLDKLTLVGRPSELRQVKKKMNPGDTLFARERIKEELSANEKKESYFLEIRNHGGTFTRKDRVRITLLQNKSPHKDPITNEMIPAVEFKAANRTGEIGAPGDGAGLTIGDTTANCSLGPTRDGRGKPEILLEKSNITFSDDKGYFGTSYSAAIFGGIVALLKAKEPGLKQHHLLHFRTQFSKNYCKTLGWKFNVDTYSSAVPRKLRSWLYDELSYSSDCATKDSSMGCKILGIRNKLNSIRLIKDLPKKVRENPDDYVFYLYIHRTERTKRVKVPDGRYKEPDRYYKQMVRRAYWKYEKKVYPNVIWYVPRLIPAEYKTVTVPGRTYRIDRGYKTVPDTPLLKVKLWYRKLTKEAFPWDDLGGRPYEYYELQQLRMPTTEKKGWLVDGSKNKPKLWKTPTPRELKQVVANN